MTRLTHLTILLCIAAIALLWLNQTQRGTGFVEQAAAPPTVEDFDDVFLSEGESVVWDNGSVELDHDSASTLTWSAGSIEIPPDRPRTNKTQ